MDVIINGINGRMGRVVLETLTEEADVTVVAGFDKFAARDDDPPCCGTRIPVYANMNEYVGNADAIIDFSHFSTVPELMRYAKTVGIPVVVATTALGNEAWEAMRDAARTTPIFHSPNMSLGVNIMAKMGKTAMPALEANYHVEIIEKHHAQKADSPSGTALLLADAINEVCADRKDYLYGRHGTHDSCKLSDLGIHAVRGGNLPGQHTILFAGPDETIEITHTVYSRRVFALGALKAARFVAGREAGLYSMDDVI
ncbi:MAG: 4-hydroxy-tetrahydrodipicolinate reductase [Clostridiales Family XIII bacterium]|jgi:4-hydroxy-tetrahydrodipicolinate reductase|nr:4-hydroxy-tetrahydrodipicolinate reductase [Clostridiales Family XIII bacterium]